MIKRIGVVIKIETDLIGDGGSGAWQRFINRLPARG